MRIDGFLRACRYWPSVVVPRYCQKCKESVFPTVGSTPKGFPKPTASTGRAGPSYAMVVLLGFHVAGPLGGAVVLVSFFAPACILTLWASRAWARFAGSAWRQSIEEGLAPVSIGLLVSGSLAIGHGAVKDLFTLALGVVAFGLTVWRRPNPALLVIGCGVLGVLRSI